MRLLFLDKYFPGHFRHLLGWLEQSEKDRHEAVFLSEFRRKDFAPQNVRHMAVRVPCKPVKGASQAQGVLAYLGRRAELFGAAMRRLKDHGFLPDVVCYNGGGGSGLYAADIFPDSLRLGVFEWFFRHPGMTANDKIGFHTDTTVEGFAPLRIRNMFQLEALQSCHCKITATAWQRDSYPVPWHDCMRILSDGVNTDFFCPGAGTAYIGEKNESAEMITFASRVLNRGAGVETFLRALPAVFAARPRSRALIVGTPDKSWEEGGAFLKKLVREAGADRIHFANFCSYKDYRAILRASNVHVFLSGSPALSMSLLEAMSSGCLLAAAATPVVREILRHGENALLVKPDDEKALAAGIARALREGERLRPLREAARRDVLRYHSETEARKAWIALVSDLTAGSDPIALDVAARPEPSRIPA